MQELDVKAFDSYVLKTMLRGRENMEIYSEETKASRKVMTLALLRVLGHELSISGWSENSKQVVWGAFTLAFFGSFRLGEILPQNENAFCPEDTLLWEDIKFVSEDHILIHLKTPKSRQPEGEFVDIFNFEGFGVCPVKALKRLKSSLTCCQLSSPVFSFSSGTFLSRRKVNEILLNFRTPYIGEEAAHVTGHSFRAAIPAVLAKFPEVASSSDIMGWGRWRSEAYLSYTRLKTDQKRTTFSTITNLLKI